MVYNCLDHIIDPGLLLYKTSFDKTGKTNPASEMDCLNRHCYYSAYTTCYIFLSPDGV